MAITRYSTGTQTGGSDMTLDIGVADNNRLVVVSYARVFDSDVSLSACTVDGKSMTELATNSPALDIGGAGMNVDMWLIWEATLGASAGSVTVAATGDTSAGAYSAMVFYGVDQTVKVLDSNKMETVTGTTITVTSIDVSAKGAVIGSFGWESDTTVSSYTSPLAGEVLIAPTFGDMAMVWGIETSAQSAKSYSTVLNASSGDTACIVISVDSAFVRRVFVT